MSLKKYGLPSALLRSRSFLKDCSSRTARVCPGAPSAVFAPHWPMARICRPGEPSWPPLERVESGRRDELRPASKVQRLGDIPTEAE